MAEGFMTSSPEESVHEGFGLGPGELDPNYSSSSLYLLGIVNQSQNASYGVEESMFRPDSPTFKQVLDLVFKKSVELGSLDREGPGVWEVVDTVRSCMFQTDEGGVGNEHEVLLHSLSVQLELQKSPGDFLTRDNFNLAMESWIHSVSSTQKDHSPASTRSYQFSDPLDHTHSLTGSYSLEGTGGASSSGRDEDNLSERVEELMRHTGQLERENNLLRQQVLESEDTISDLTEIRERLESRLSELRIAIHNNQSLTLENSALKQELTKLDSSLSQTKQRLFQETKHRQTLESELEHCTRLQETQPLIHGDTYVMESYGDSVQPEAGNELAELQQQFGLATGELTQLYEENENLNRRLSFLIEKNEDLCQQIEDLEQELGHRSLSTPTVPHNSTPPQLPCHTPSLEQELTGALYTSPTPNGVKFYSSTPLSSVHIARENIFDVSNSSIELLETLSTDPSWQQLCSLKSAQSDLISQKTNEIMSDIKQLDCGQEYSRILDQFRTKHRQLQSELEASLQLRGESEKEAGLLQTEVSRLKELVSRLQQQLEELSQVKSHGDTLIAELSTKDDVIRQLSGELQNLSQKPNPNDTRVFALEERRSSLCAENAKLLTCVGAKSNLIEQLTTDRDQVQYKLDDVTKQLQLKTQELEGLEANRVEIENKLNITAQELTAKEEETRVAILEKQHTLTELNTQRTNAAIVVDRLKQTEIEFEAFQREHASCLRDIWYLSQTNPCPMDPSFTPTLQQVKHAVIQRIRTGSPSKHLPQSLNVSPSRDSNTSTSLSLTPTAFSSPLSKSVSRDISLEEKVRAIQIWFSSARYTTKPTCLAWKQHLCTLEATIYSRMGELDKLLVNGDFKQAGKLLKSLRNSISVLGNSSHRVGGLDHECSDIENYRVLLEYIDCIKRSPCVSVAGNRSVKLDTPCRNRNEEPLIEDREKERIEHRLFETNRNLFPAFKDDIASLIQKEKTLRKRADELTNTIKAIKPVKKGVTFRGLLINFHLSLSLFFLLVIAYLLIGQLPSSLPIIRHKLLFGPAFSFSKYFIGSSNFTPIT